MEVTGDVLRAAADEVDRWAEEAYVHVHTVELTVDGASGGTRVTATADVVEREDEPDGPLVWNGGGEITLTFTVSDSGHVSDREEGE